MASGLTGGRKCSLFVLIEPAIRGHPAMRDNLPFKVVRTNGRDEIVARANNLLVGRAAFETARRLYPNDRVDYRDGARVIACSEPDGASPELKGSQR
jgi:hypothetical protein